MNNTAKALEMGLAFVSEDRRGGVGLVLQDTVANNIVLTSMQTQGRFLKQGGLFKLKDKRAILDHALQTIEQFDIRCTGPPNR